LRPNALPVSLAKSSAQLRGPHERQGRLKSALRAKQRKKADVRSVKLNERLAVEPMRHRRECATTTKQASRGSECLTPRRQSRSHPQQRTDETP
jgi:hypothetical protein